MKVVFSPAAKANLLEIALYIAQDNSVRALSFVDELEVKCLKLGQAAETRGAGCRCGGVLHSARYPRKPRGCPVQVREDYSWRFSFCCARCDRRTTSASVRFLGRRVYLAVVLALVSPPGSATAQHLAKVLTIPVRTLARWRTWWRTWWHRDFLRTPFWRSMRARFQAPAPSERLPQSLLERFEAAFPAQRLVLVALSCALE